MNRPAGSNADEWVLFLKYWMDDHLDQDITPFLAVQIAEAIDDQAGRKEISDLEVEIERMRAALNEIIELAHYPDATIARRALGMPVTDREALEQRAQSAEEIAQSKVRSGEWPP